MNGIHAHNTLHIFDCDILLIYESIAKFSDVMEIAKTLDALPEDKDISCLNELKEIEAFDAHEKSLVVNNTFMHFNSEGSFSYIMKCDLRPGYFVISCH